MTKQSKIDKKVAELKTKTVSVAKKIAETKVVRRSSGVWSPVLNRAEKSGFGLLFYMLSGWKFGSLDIELPNGDKRHFEGAEPGPKAVWRIKSFKTLWHLLEGGEVGIGDAYVADCWDSPDLTSLLQALYLNEPYYKGPFESNKLSRVHGWWQHKRRANRQKQAVSNIQYHYDLGNEFYKMWLDETLAYSAGMYLAPSDDLKTAQLNKFKLLFDRLNLRPEHELLEIGSGWGGFAIYAAVHSGCRVHSITLSEEQLIEARKRAEAAGVSDRVTFALTDYREVSGVYDRIVSIEMYEAVGEEFWPVYWSSISSLLKKDGIAALQGITINPSIWDNYRTKRDFIQKYIFPGGMLAPAGHFLDLARASGLVPDHIRFYAKDYADTLAAWHRNVLEAEKSIVSRFDARFLRMWRYYLSYCECGFRVGSLDLMQVTLKKH